MPPKKEITKDMILISAFNLVREQGYLQLTARNLAGYMKCSTMPIYSEIENMEALERDVAGKSLDLLIKYQITRYADDPVLSISLGTLRFSLNEKELFKVMMLNDDPGQKETRALMQNKAREEITEFLRKIGSCTEREITDMQEILKKMMIFTIGLCVSFHFNAVSVTKEELEERIRDYYRLLENH